MRLRVTLAAAFGVLALAGPAFAAAPAPDCHGLMLDDADGDQYIGTSANTLVRPTVAIDIDDVFVTGTGAGTKVNIRVADLTSSPNLGFTFHWDDPVNAGYTYELTAQYLTASGAAGTGGYTFWHYDPSGSFVSAMGASGAAFTGPQGVIQFDQPSSITPHDVHRGDGPGRAVRDERLHRRRAPRRHRVGLLVDLSLLS